MNTANQLYRGYYFPSEIMDYAVWLYHRFCLSFRNIEDLLAERGIVISYETIRSWCNKFGSTYARMIKKLMKGQGRSARKIVTNKLPICGAAKKEAMSTSMHCHERYANNRAEVSHEHTRAQERHMRKFKSPGQTHRFLAVHSQVHNLFRVGRYLYQAVNYRLLRNRSFGTRQQVACAY